MEKIKPKSSISINETNNNIKSKCKDETINCINEKPKQGKTLKLKLKIKKHSENKSKIKLKPKLKPKLKIKLKPKVKNKKPTSKEINSDTPYINIELINSLPKLTIKYNIKSSVPINNNISILKNIKKKLKLNYLKTPHILIEKTDNTPLKSSEYDPNSFQTNEKILQNTLEDTIDNDHKEDVNEDTIDNEHTKDVDDDNGEEYSEYDNDANYIYSVGNSNDLDEYNKLLLIKDSLEELVLNDIIYYVDYNEGIIYDENYTITGNIDESGKILLND
jgi:hypothetical protein